MNPRFMRNGALMILLALGVAALLYTWFNQTTGTAATGYGTFLNQVGAGDVKMVVQQSDTLTVTKTDGTTYTVTIPSILTSVLGDMQQASSDAGRTWCPILKLGACRTWKMSVAASDSRLEAAIGRATPVVGCCLGLRASDPGFGGGA